MNLFEIVKYGVSCREAAELYGVEVNRYGMALCPFHNDRHPSLYVADDHYYRFFCDTHFLFAKKKQKQERKDGENEWRSTTWKQRWSAEVRDGLRLQLPLI